jgi:hypothetical protein
VIPRTSNSRHRSKPDIIKDIVAAVHKLIHVPKTIDLEELLQELRDASDQWQTLLDAKLQNANYTSSKSSGHVALKAYVDALSPHCAIIFRTNHKYRSKADIIKDIVAAIHNLINVGTTAVVEELLQETDSTQPQQSEALRMLSDLEGRLRHKGPCIANAEWQDSLAGIMRKATKHKRCQIEELSQAEDATRLSKLRKVVQSWTAP